MLLRRLRVHVTVRFGTGLTRICIQTASTDGTVQLHAYPLPLRPLNSVPVLAHPAPVKCLLPLPAALGESYVLSGAGDAIRTYDFSSLEEPEFLSEFDAHANDVTSLAYWHRSVPGKRQPEAWIVSASMDGTVRRWRLAGKQQSERRRLPPFAVGGNETAQRRCKANSRCLPSARTRLAKSQNAGIPHTDTAASHAGRTRGGSDGGRRTRTGRSHGFGRLVERRQRGEPGT